jgi:ubiquinone/menaquinone biosynthesis C-methylase UbiE
MATKSSYTIGHKEAALAYMRFRTAERCCAFFRQHVQVDSRVLDCGCGPGSITLGLAQWAPDGQTVGIDLAEEQLVGARVNAHELRVQNVTFRQASIFDLPFDDDSFDVVFSQAVFCHIPDHAQALREMKRVLRPGGLVAIRDIINGSVIRWPDDPLLGEVGRLCRLGEQRSGGNPDVGRELGTLLDAAGFVDVFLTLGFEQPEQPEERAAYFGLIAAIFESGDLGTLAVQERWTTSERLTQMIERYRDLANQPGAISALPFGQAVGRKPR